jgi:hypothetical protein
MSGSPKKELAQQYKNKIDKATGDALRGVPPDELQSQLQQIESYSKLVSLNDKQHWTADAKWAVLVGLFCLGVASLLWSYKVRKNSVSLTVDTETIQGVLKSDWHLDKPFRAELLHVERVSKLEAPNLHVSLESPQGDAWIRLDGGKIRLQSLDVAQDASLALAADPTEVGIFVSGQPMRGKITIMGKGEITGGSEPGQTLVRRSYDLDVPETLEFSVSDPRAVPSRLTIHNPQKWSLGKAPFASLNFAVEETRDFTETSFASGIKSGSLTFNDTAWPQQAISERDILAIHDTRQCVVELSGQDGLIHVSLNGIGGGVTIGQGDAKRELAPSYLEYLYNKKKFSFFWGSAIGVWGVIWGIRKTIFR